MSSMVYYHRNILGISMSCPGYIRSGERLRNDEENTFYFHRNPRKQLVPHFPVQFDGKTPNHCPQMLFQPPQLQFILPHVLTCLSSSLNNEMIYHYQ